MTDTRQRSLFDVQRRWDEDTARRRMIVACARELRKLAARRGEFGVTADDTRKIAVAKGFVTGHEGAQRALSWLASVPRVARLRRTARTRINHQRNQQRVFVIRESWT